MIANFSVCKKGNCGITVTGEETNVTTDVFGFRDYLYSECATIDVLIKLDSNDTPTLKEDLTQISVHTSTSVDALDIEFPEDGLFQVSHIVIPTQVWLNKWSPSFQIDLYSGVYYYDSTTSKYMQYNVKTGTKTEITLNDLLSADYSIPTSSTSDGSIITVSGTNVVRGDKYVFCTCNLMECFYKLAKGLLTTFCNKCVDKLENNKTAIQNRDLVWMAINVIKYLIGFGQYFEAQRILESITQCGNTICESLSTKSGGNSCGCS